MLNLYMNSITSSNYSEQYSDTINRSCEDSPSGLRISIVLQSHKLMQTKYLRKQFEHF